MISFIWAQDKNGVIGKNGTMPWHIPTDLNFFKKMTMNKPLVFGRKTFVGMGSRLLKGREMILLTKDNTYHKEGVKILSDIQPILEESKKKEIMIGGGSEIFSLFYPYVDRLIVTFLNAEFEGETKIPVFDYALFHLIHKEYFLDEKSKVSGYFCIYDRN